MAQITYLFGAGASSNSVPVVKNIPDELRHFSHYLDTFERQLSQEQLSARDALSTFVKGLTDERSREIKDESGKSKYIPRVASIDTLAKQYTITRRWDDFDRLKMITALFFAFHQHLKGPDIRYDSFFASLLQDSGLQLPPIRILSWNYDRQFEFSFGKFANEDTARMNVLRKGSHRLKDEVNDGFCIIKLNGEASFQDRVDGEEHPLWVSSENLDSQVLKIIESFILWREKRIKSRLWFSWENLDKDYKQVERVALTAAAQTEILVIIGYSFPFFNRNIDRWIISRLPFLRKVYIQDLEPQKIETRLRATHGSMTNQKNEKIEVVHWNDVDQFALPDEL